MLRTCILTWSYDEDELDRYRISKRQLVNYKVEFAVDLNALREDVKKLKYDYLQTITSGGTIPSTEWRAYVWTLQSEGIT